MTSRFHQAPTLKRALVGAVVWAASQASIAQQQEFSFFSGIQESPHSSVQIGGTKFTAGWEGHSLKAPFYYGFRYTRWMSEDTAWSLNFTHTKAYSNAETRAKNGYKTLELTDGSNPITVNYIKSLSEVYGFKPYLSAGAGIAVPHVEIQRQAELDSKRTFEFQYGGPVLRLSAGFSRPINQSWRLFAEYDFQYLMLNLKHNDERMKTNLIHNALNLGLAYRF